MLDIRLCQSKDLLELQAIAAETFRDTFAESILEPNMTQYIEEAYDLTQLESELNASCSETYLAFLENQLAAYLKINWSTAQTEEMGEQTLEIQRIYVRSAFKRKGIGKQLLDIAYNRAKALKKSSIWLGVWEKNFAAQAFYQSEGFIKIGEHAFPAGDQVDIDWIMEKKF
ncbi:GNAT family N-acetyltransferase [Tuanshanicoccus lijuaniae]|uniref:GNAT family N-acetyltransferase n=1 Tax=Aerococcaceae bacterium zg-1292 TaxID=2774330 RepID=UPI001BD8DCB7|nr:GNAT family N-acetyltransferase [Aerococcaceae bacterium zg-A91]MBS4457674.1 GNAT family N-acetyltransferase [Aerococcaceae bacterium zg-BR33]